MWGSEGMIKLYGIHDEGVDILGGNRGPEPVPPDFRGRAGWRHQQEILEGLYFQGQVAYLSDKNFLEQYYKNEFDLGPNQETFAYLTWNRGNSWASGLAEVRLERPWVPETQWLPRLDGALIGQSFFDLFVYCARANAGYALARRTDINPVSLLATDQNIDTGRIDLMQELSLPFSLGPVKLAPYGMVDLTGYTDDLTGDSAGRVWGGGGIAGEPAVLAALRGRGERPVQRPRALPQGRARARTTSTPARRSRTRSCRCSTGSTTTPPTRPGATSRRCSPTSSPARTASCCQDAPDPLSPFNPQRYAIRRLVQNRVDTLDDINVLQLDLRQRLQTKRGYPGLEHTVDLATLSTSVSYFPEASRDNFGHPFAFLEYDFVWNVGDRTALCHHRLVRAVRRRARSTSPSGVSSTAPTARTSTSATARSTRSTAARCWARSATS